MENEKLSEAAMFKYLIHAAITIQAQNKGIISLLVKMHETEDPEIKSKVERLIQKSETEFSDVLRQFADMK